MGNLHQVGAGARATGQRSGLGLAPHALDVGYSVQRRGLAQGLARLVLDTDDAAQRADPRPA